MSRNVVFVAPFPTDVTMRFVRAAAGLDDVKLLGIVHTPPPGDDARLFHDVVRVDNPLRVQELVDGVEVLARRHGPPVRILGILEAMMVELAEVRERCGVEGTSVKTATLFREKAMMKDALRAAGLPVARHALLTSERDAKAFAEEIGFPMVVKPPAGMGGKSTFRVRTLPELLKATRDMRAAPETPLLAEEMLTGKEHSFETITLAGEPRVSSFASYFPGPLEVLEKPWIQWACVLPREVDSELHARARKLGQDAIKALGLQNGMTHMEWFEKADGTLAIGEIAQRPPGPQLCQMTGLVHGIDIYRAWARAVVDGELDAPWERRYAAGTAFVRGMGQGRVAGVTGVRETHEAVGEWLVEAKLPTLGARKNDSYEGDGYVVVRHESTAKVHALITSIIETMKVHYAS
jgi:formate-dependent phosphoribosylglycinamide formyltransferase (GAR transformylase)